MTQGPSQGGGFVPGAPPPLPPPATGYPYPSPQPQQPWPPPQGYFAPQGFWPLPPRPPRVWPCFVSVVCVFAGHLAVGILAAIVIVTTGPSGPVRTAEDISNAVVEAFNNPRIFLTVIGISVLVTLAGGAVPAMLSPVPFAKRLHLGRTRTRWWQDVLLVVASLAVGWTLTLLLTLLQLDRGGIIEELNKSMSQMRGPLLAMGVLIIGVIGPFAEEVLFRGYVQTRLSERWGPVAAVLIAATLFGLLHFDLVHSPFAFGFGLALGYATERSGSIWPAVWAHMINNTVSVFLSAWGLDGPEKPLHIWITVAVMAAVAVVCVILVELKRPAPQAALVEGTHGTT